MSEAMVCAGCGSPDFIQTRTTRTEFALRFGSFSGPMECSETCVDSGDLGGGDVVCAGCGAAFGIDYMDDPDYLVTESAYNESE